MLKGALDGIKVVEYATMVSGPYCGKLLADMGADVIKVEPPGGDPSRLCGPFPGGEKHPEKSALFLYNNTSKRGLTLDIEKPEGLDAFKKLLQWADVFIDNYPSDYFEKLGLNWNNLQQLNAGLIYASITPYGRTGPRAKFKGDELTIVHAGGEGNLMPVRSVDLSFPPVMFGSYQGRLSRRSCCRPCHYGAGAGEDEDGRGAYDRYFSPGSDGCATCSRASWCAL